MSPEDVETADTASTSPSRRLLSRPNIHRAARYVLGGGSVLFSLAATAEPSRLARAIDIEEDELRRLAMRDLGAGISLLTGSKKLGPVVSRLRYDLRSTLTLLRKRPALAPWTIALVLVGVIAILTRD